LLQGYAERKVLLLCDVVKASKELHAAGAKQERAKLQASFRQVGGLENMHLQYASNDQNWKSRRANRREDERSWVSWGQTQQHIQGGDIYASSM